MDNSPKNEDLLTLILFQNCTAVFVHTFKANGIQNNTGSQNIPQNMFFYVPENHRGLKQHEVK